MTETCRRGASTSRELDQETLLQQRSIEKSIISNVLHNVSRQSIPSVGASGLAAESVAPVAYFTTGRNTLILQKQSSQRY